MSPWIAALPMYNVTPRHAQSWRALLRDALDVFARTGGGVADATILDEPFGDLTVLWRRDNLLLSQTCGFPYRVLGLADTVHLIATPMFEAEGCEGPRYCSAIVVSATAWARGAASLAACRGLHAACNGEDSHSGMNALRHAVAPHASEGRFFASVAWTGSHLASLRAVSGGQADVAAIDCVTLALLRDASPDLLAGVKVVDMTASAPGLPFIASRTLDERQAALLRNALDAAHAADPERARFLRLRGFARLARDDYDTIEAMANTATSFGYPRLN
ncbi:phosphate/phosphite/phosphonate ABC transporter substrate-binding protein [Paraburkholderia acidipaludis]|uniref:phosphate/phosphite/phosphonate ABC transporter substrate-binding protein n=1 Tax=Paraburkholderia acidipaludis TaxID=660537 RepID=UPI0004833358|nr:PhnD/SsuA/transferrin family substrate-binding protein [Paraburkholderia acidipaludis]